jgi:cytosine/adenosine deaminase-related metal-dependent hydrolase
LRSGYVVVSDGRVAEVRTTKPNGVRITATEGVILPGLIDLHGHPEFNVFAAWEPPRRFSNRYIWRADDLYHQLVRDPQNLLLTALPPRTEIRYAEVRALVGGVTAIQGASARTVRSPDTEPLVRNVDLWIFGQHRARAMIDLPSGRSGRSWDQLQKILAEIKNGDVDAFYLHLCEGRRDDRRSQTEFAHFLDFHAATPATVVIHASALSTAQLGQLHDAQCSLVWSPQSNLRLYDETTLAADALKLGMPVALGADWLPSGSTSLLAEMKVARRVLHEQGMDIAPANLVEMVTSTAAGIAGLSGHLGALSADRPADVLVLERRQDDPYENVCLAEPSWVELVLIGGDVTYGRQDWFDQLSGAARGTTIDSFSAWGKPMRLDTGYQVNPGAPVPSLSQLRADLIGAYPQVGPVFA